MNQKVIENASGIIVECPECGSIRVSYGIPKSIKKLEYETEFRCKQCKMKFKVTEKFGGFYRRIYEWEGQEKVSPKH